MITSWGYLLLQPCNECVQLILYYSSCLFRHQLQSHTQNSITHLLIWWNETSVVWLNFVNKACVIKALLGSFSYVRVGWDECFVGGEMCICQDFIYSILTQRVRCGTINLFIFNYIWFSQFAHFQHHSVWYQLDE